MAGIHSVMHQFHAGLELCRLCAEIIEAKPRITEELAQLSQLRKDLYLAVLEAAVTLTGQHLLQLQRIGRIQCFLDVYKRQGPGRADIIRLEHFQHIGPGVAHKAAHAGDSKHGDRQYIVHSHIQDMADARIILSRGGHALQRKPCLLYTSRCV